MKVAVVGGTGAVGRLLSRSLIEGRHQVTVSGRSVPNQGQPGMRWARIDIATGDGLRQALAGAESVVHLASSPSQARKVDVSGTRRLLELIGDRHLIYLSIVGVDRHPLPYYRAKHAAENLIENAGGRHTIVRATQFHDLIAYRVDRMTHGPVANVPRGYVYQPIDVREVVDHLGNLVESDPLGRVPDLAGPEVLGIEHLARTYMAAKRKRRPLVRLPRFGPVAAAFRNGVHTNPDRAGGKVTWADHLARRFGTLPIS
jgi:uncharacterized protein YbjT (DUF2867 family)